MKTVLMLLKRRKTKPKRKTGNKTIQLEIWLSMSKRIFRIEREIKDLELQKV
jgi:hypothetical protein